MNRERAKELWPILKAYAEGAEIEYKSKSCQEWYECSPPSFLDELTYRIKPETSYTPFSTQEEFNQLIGKPLIQKDTGNGIVGISTSRDVAGSRVLWFFNGSGSTGTELLLRFTFPDGTPVGKRQ